MTEEEIAEWRRIVALTRDVVHPSRPLLGEPAIMEKALATLSSRTARIGALEGLLREVYVEWKHQGGWSAKRADIIARIDAALKEKP